MFEKYASRHSQPARLIWMSSLEGRPCWYDRDDWQLVKTDHSYEGSKYEIDLIFSKLNQRSLLPGGESNAVRHFLVHPGVLHSNMTNGMVYVFFDTIKVLLFYIVSLSSLPGDLRSVSYLFILPRLDGSAHHTTPSHRTQLPFRQHTSLSPRSWQSPRASSPSHTETNRTTLHARCGTTASRYFPSTAQVWRPHQRHARQSSVETMYP